MSHVDDDQWKPMFPYRSDSTPIENCFEALKATRERLAEFEKANEELRQENESLLLLKTDLKEWHDTFGPYGCEPQACLASLLTTHQADPDQSRAHTFSGQPIDTTEFISECLRMQLALASLAAKLI